MCSVETAQICRLARAFADRICNSRTKSLELTHYILGINVGYSVLPTEKIIYHATVLFCAISSGSKRFLCMGFSAYKSSMVLLTAVHGGCHLVLPRVAIVESNRKVDTTKPSLVKMCGCWPIF